MAPAVAAGIVNRMRASPPTPAWRLVLAVAAGCGLVLACSGPADESGTAEPVEESVAQETAEERDGAVLLIQMTFQTKSERDRPLEIFTLRSGVRMRNSN